MWVSFLDKIVADRPDHLALVDQKSGERLTYRELDDHVRRLASFLEAHGVTHGERVSYFSTNQSLHLTLLLACSHLGAIFVPLNFRLSRGELHDISRRIHARINLYHGELPYECVGEAFDIDGLKLQEFVPLKESRPTKATDPLLMLFTSGSTGEPKGVLLHGQMLESNQRETVKGWGLVPSDVAIVETPFFHTGGYNVLCLPLLSIGASVVIAEKFDTQNFYQSVKDEGLTVYFGVPTMFQMIASDPLFKAQNLKSLRFLVSGGAAIPVGLINQYQELGLMFKQGFGLTEVGPNCFLLDEKDAKRKAGSIGRPMPHSKVLVIKDDGNQAKVGEVGELLIGGPHVCAGYFRDEARFKESLFDGHFKTGDLVSFDEENFFFVTGRKKDMYISGGENVYPAEVEKQLALHPLVADSVIVPVPHERWGEVGFAFIRPKVPQNQEMTVEGIRDFLADKLSRYKQPHHLKVMVDFPLLASGKIDRKQLGSIALDIVK